MPKKKNTIEQQDTLNSMKAHIEGAGNIVNQDIVDTLELNYMPYAMSVIMSRAIPEIDGFKPSHRKLLYTMYKMGLLTGNTIKSANIVGRTMQLNPHGDAAIYETMVRMTRGNESLLYPYIESKGNFGKSYSKNMAYAASRYTEAKLSAISNELFRDIDKDTIDFVPNYDNSTTEPTLFPVSFPTILANSNMGIAVGMASNICSFNIKELCETTIGLIKDDEFDIFETLKAPDFPGGAYLLYNRAQLEDIYNTGRGSIKIRSRYDYEKNGNRINITEIPPTTTSEAIIDKVIELVKSNKIKEISDIRDETDKSGLKITIDLKRGVEPDTLMFKLFNMTTLEDSFGCNINVLISGSPRVLGVRELLLEWIAFRAECVRRRVYFECNKNKEKLHLLEGLEKILLDIDKAVSIVRNTSQETEVVPNLMIGFGIDKIQAEYVAEIKLRHLNREYIVNRTADIERLRKEIDDLEDILSKKSRILKIIVDELNEVIKKYVKPRKTEILYDFESSKQTEIQTETPNYDVILFFTKEGYFKKITPQSLRMSGAQKLKEGDKIIEEIEVTNNTELLFFSNMNNCYKSNACEFSDGKASILGDYIATTLLMEADETAVYMAAIKEYIGYMVFFFENGKCAKIDISAYETKTNRKRLVKAFSDKSPLVSAFYIKEDCEFVLYNSNGKVLLMNTGAIASKTTKDSQGVAVMKLKKNSVLNNVKPYQDGMFENPSRYRTKSLPTTGTVLSADDIGEQIKM